MFVSSHAQVWMADGIWYCIQAVDHFRHEQPKERYREALEFMNLSKTANLHGLLLVYIGMRIRLTKKIFPPKLVQEATGEVVGIVFHPEESFGHPASTCLRPADSHTCWQTGVAVCDRLPLHIEVRFDGRSEDYTGLGKPGVWLLTPSKDTWQLPISSTTTINHPNVRGKTYVKLKAKRNATVEVTRCGFAITHEDPRTFQNWQGSTVKEQQGEPTGFVVDLARPRDMGDPEYFQHLYMILGRARKLDWILLRNFPLTGDGSPDWFIFEGGPPNYLCEFMEKLQKREKETLGRLRHTQRQSGMPAWEKLPECAKDADNNGRFLYDPQYLAFKIKQDGPDDQHFHVL